MRAYLFCATLAFCFAANSASGVTTHITVQNTNDSGPGSLRQAIFDSTIGGTIDFTNTVFATPKTIVLSTTNENGFGPSALNINKTLFILGPAAPNAVTLAISPGSPMRHFHVVSDGGLTLSNLVLAGGQVAGGAGGSAFQRGGSGGGAAGLGGAILNQGAVVTLLNCVFATNQAIGGAGGTNQLGSGGGGLGSGAGGGGVSGNGAGGGGLFVGGIGGLPTGGSGGTNQAPGFPGGTGGGGGGGGSSFASQGGTGTNGFGGDGGAGGFGGGGAGGGAYDTEGFPGGPGGAGGTGGFGGGGGGGGPGTPPGAIGQGGFGGGSGGTTDNSGNAGTGGGGGAGFGGAIFNDAGTLAVTNCAFANNSVVGGLGGAGTILPGGNGSAYGGAIFNRNGSVVISGGSFSGDTGGDIYNLGDGAGKVAKVTLLGVTASRTNNAINGGVALPPGAPHIFSAQRLSNGKFQLSFTNLSGTNFTVIASTNPALPAASWTSLGAPTQAVGNLYQFTDPTPSNRNFFYQLRFP